ncbi:helix-turn-helix domain-containing protein [Pseudomonadota bacterium]
MKLTGPLLKAARILARLEQAEVAQETGMSVTTIRRMERDEKKVDGSKAFTILYTQILEKHGIEFIETKKGVGIIIHNKDQ